MAGGDQIPDHIQPGGGQEQLPEQPPPQVPKPELQRRIVIMFSGKIGTVVRSGDVAATSAPTYQIIIDIFEEMDELEKRSPALFDKHAKHRPCGLLDKYGAAGMLVGDVLGLPLMPWELAEKVGKAAAKLPAQLTGEKKKAKLAAKRNGMPPHSTPPHPTLPNPTCCIPSHPLHPTLCIPFHSNSPCSALPHPPPPHPTPEGVNAEKAAAEVLYRVVKLKLPTAAQITQVLRQIARKRAELEAQSTATSTVTAEPPAPAEMPAEPPAPTKPPVPESPAPGLRTTRDARRWDRIKRSWEPPPYGGLCEPAWP